MHHLFWFFLVWQSESTKLVMHFHLKYLGCGRQPALEYICLIVYPVATDT
jgi:hypothetical protein